MTSRGRLVAASTRRPRDAAVSCPQPRWWRPTPYEPLITRESTSMIRLSRCLATVLVCALLTVCGCSADDRTAQDPGAASEQDPGSASAVAKDQAHWTLPTDPYSPSRDEALSAQAFDTVRAPCMRKAGFPQVTIGWDASAPAPATLAGDGFTRVFNEDLAARYGYRAAPDPRNLQEADILAAGEGGLWTHESQDFWDALNKCNHEADEALKPEDSDDRQAESDQTIAVSSQLDRLQVDTTVGELADAAAAWRTCMAPLGIVDLPAQPWRPGAMLPDSLLERWDWRPVGAPSADEIQVAAADAACRRSSGWFDALYEAEWQLRETFVKEHRTELESFRLGLDTARARYLSVIAGKSS